MYREIGRKEWFRNRIVEDEWAGLGNRTLFVISHELRRTCWHRSRPARLGGVRKVMCARLRVTPPGTDCLLVSQVLVLFIHELRRTWSLTRHSCTDSLATARITYTRLPFSFFMNFGEAGPRHDSSDNSWRRAKHLLECSF